MPSPIKITAVLTARPGKNEGLKALLFGMATHSRAEAGNLAWDIWQNQAQPDCYVLDELYVDETAVAAHRQTPHYQDYLLRIGDLADRTALVLNPILIENESVKSFRRIVTGHDQDGCAVLLSDAPPARVHQIGGPGGPTFFEVWNTRETPVVIDRQSGEPMENGLVRAPPVGGARIRVIDFPPEGDATGTAASPLS